jgi:hypothetical protein
VSNNSKLGVFSIESGKLLRSMTHPQTVDFSNVFIDDLATFMGYLDSSQRFVNIMVFEWDYKFIKPAKRPKNLKEPNQPDRSLIKKDIEALSPKEQKEIFKSLSPKDKTPKVEKVKSPKKEKPKPKKSSVCTLF